MTDAGYIYHTYEVAYPPRQSIYLDIRAWAH